jgi:hypothetical protein
LAPNLFTRPLTRDLIFAWLPGYPILPVS